VLQLLLKRRIYIYKVNKVIAVCLNNKFIYIKLKQRFRLFTKSFRWKRRTSRHCEKSYRSILFELAFFNRKSRKLGIFCGFSFCTICTTLKGWKRHVMFNPLLSRHRVNLFWKNRSIRCPIPVLFENIHRFGTTHTIYTNKLVCARLVKCSWSNCYGGVWSIERSIHIPRRNVKWVMIFFS